MPFAGHVLAMVPVAEAAAAGPQSMEHLFEVILSCSVREDELRQLLVECGLSPLDALRTATLNPAQFRTAAEMIGSISPGKVADLPLLRANPLDDISHTRQISAVVTRGRVLDRKALDEILQGMDGEENKKERASD